MNNVDSVRYKLRSFVTAAEGKRLRSYLEQFANNNYLHKFTLEEYLKYMNKNECSFDRNGCQDTNHPYVWTMFSVPSQHIMGDCIEECLDIAIIKSIKPIDLI